MKNECLLLYSQESRRQTLSWAGQLQSIYSHSVSLTQILLLSSHLFLDLTSGSFSSLYQTINNIQYPFLP